MFSIYRDGIQYRGYHSPGRFLVDGTEVYLPAGMFPHPDAADYTLYFCKWRDTHILALSFNQIALIDIASGAAVCGRGVPNFDTWHGYCYRGNGPCRDDVININSEVLWVQNADKEVVIYVLPALTRFVIGTGCNFDISKLDPHTQKVIKPQVKEYLAKYRPMYEKMLTYLNED